MKSLILLFFLCFANSIINSQDIWKPSSGPTGLHISDVVFNSFNEIFISARNNGIYRSKDHGANWSLITNGLNTSDSYARQLVAGSNGIIFGIINNTIYKLERTSDVWINLNFSITDVATLTTNPQGDLYILNQLTRTISRSTDNGENFNVILNSSLISSINNAVFLGGDKNYFTVIDGGALGLYRMNDDGSGFFRVYISLDQIRFIVNPQGYLFVYEKEKDSLNRMDLYGLNVQEISFPDNVLQKMVISPDGNLLIYTDQGDYESVDSGLNFIKKSSQLYLKAIDQSEIYFTENAIYIYNYDCSIGSFEKTINLGNNWETLENKFLNPFVTEIFIDNLQRIFAKTCERGSYSYSLDRAVSWHTLPMPGNNKNSTNLVSCANGNLFILSDSKLYQSTDLGKTWIQNDILGVSNFTQLFGDNDNRLLIYSQSNCFGTINAGTNWFAIAKPGFVIDKLHFHPDGSIIATSNDVFVPGVYLSADNGRNWNNSNFDFFYIDAMAISKTGEIVISGSTLFEFGIFVSKDKLNTAKKLKSDVYSSLLYDDFNRLYGVFISKCETSVDSGKTWTKFDTGLPVYRIYRSLDIDQDGFLYLGMEDDVVYKTSRSVTSIISIQENYYEKIVSVYPNPLTNMLNISSSKFPINSFDLFTLQGISVISGITNNQNVSVDISDLVGGLYLLKIGINGASYTKKINAVSK